MKMENKLKYLEFIQNVITRMNTNSFMIKGWTVTLVAALFALSAANTDKDFYLVAFLPVLVFWLLDGFFIATERRFRALYRKASKIQNDDAVDFDMNPYFNVKLIEERGGNKLTNCEKLLNWCRIKWSMIFHWILGTFSITLIPFYGITILIMFILKGAFYG